MLPGKFNFLTFLNIAVMELFIIKFYRSVLWFTALVIVIGNALPAWYLSTVHQKGPIDVMTHVQQIATEYRDENEHRASILFLMPCHSTPYYRFVQ